MCQKNISENSICPYLKLTLLRSRFDDQYVPLSRHKEHPRLNSSPGGGCAQPRGQGVPAGSALPCGAAGQGGSCFSCIMPCILPNSLWQLRGAVARRGLAGVSKARARARGARVR